jgi:hypothetical protein
MTPIDRLTCIEEIKALKARYFRSVDDQDWPAYGKVFTRTGTLEVPGAEGAAVKYTGADVIVAMVKEFLLGARSVHHGHMPEIDIHSSDRASGIWAMEDRLSWPDRRFHGFGRYHEDYVRESDGWHIAYCRLERISLEWT